MDIPGRLPTLADIILVQSFIAVIRNHDLIRVFIRRQLVHGLLLDFRVQMNQDLRVRTPGLELVARLES